MAKNIRIAVLATPNCQNCAKFDAYWHSIEKDWPNVIYKKIDATSEEGRKLISQYIIMASPGIIINDELFAVGGFDPEKFIAKLKELSI
jgi:glutaredoxin